MSPVWVYMWYVHIHIYLGRSHASYRVTEKNIRHLYYPFTLCDLMWPEQPVQYYFFQYHTKKWSSEGLET